MTKEERQRFLRNYLKILRSYHAAMGGEQSEQLNVAFMQAAIKIVEHKEKSKKSNVVNFPTVVRRVKNEASNKKSHNKNSGVRRAHSNRCAFGSKCVILNFG